MDKGAKKIVKYVEKIKKHNEKALKKEIDKIVNLKVGRFKSMDLSTIGIQEDGKFEVFVHNDTKNFHQTTEHLLMSMREYQQKYPFLDLHLAKGNETQKITIKVFWSDYLEFALPSMAKPAMLPDLGAEGGLKAICDKNAMKLQEALETILREADARKTEQYGDCQIKLVPHTMQIPETRNDFFQTAQRMQNQYSFVEIYRLKLNIVLIRVWWGLYFSYIRTNNGGVGLFEGKSSSTTTSAKKKIGKAVKTVVQAAVSEGMYPPVRV